MYLCLKFRCEIILSALKILTLPLFPLMKEVRSIICITMLQEINISKFSLYGQAVLKFVNKHLSRNSQGKSQADYEPCKAKHFCIKDKP